MKLTRIEALRYGALQDACLSGFGDGLTVVLGPNESGKSTFTALTRHVLYGYQDGRKKGASYKPRTGDRAGRLVFSDDCGEWAIERVDGKHGGPVTASAISGPDRPELLSELVAGVSEPSFRAVFGFGLGELALVGEDVTHDSIVAKLYAAGAGLTVNPMDVRATLSARAGELFAPKASKPEVNALAKEIRDAKQTLRELEAEALRHAGEQARLSELAENLAPLKARRDELEVAANAVERDVQRLADACEQSFAVDAELAQTDAALAELARSAEVIDVDERVLAIAPELSALLEETSGFRQRYEAMIKYENAAEDVQRRIQTGPVLPAGAADTVENRAAIEVWRDRLMRLQTEAEAAERGALQSDAKARGFEAVAREQAVSAPPTSRSKTLIAFAAIAVLLGAIFMATGLLVAPQQLLVSALGAAVVVLGAIGIALALFRRQPQPTVEPLSGEAARLRSDAEGARVLATESRKQAEVAKEEWRSWLREQDLDAYGEDAAAVRQLLDDVRARGELEAEADRYRTAATREQAAAEEWVVRLVDAARRFDDSAGQIPPLSAALELASRVRAALERALAAHDERACIERDTATVRANRRNLCERAERAAAAIAQIVTAHDVDPVDPLPRLKALAASIQEERAAARLAYEEMTIEYSGLNARLDNEGRDDRMTRARQELEGIQARAATAGDRYVVAALAMHLMDRARERFDRERQPEVVRVAGRVFSRMTLGRYTDVRIPMDAGISVVTAAGDLKPVAELSQGTAEQLYLALRVGLISSLGATGQHLPVLMDDIAVNYDPERLAAASTAITELVSAPRQVILFTCHPATAEVMMASVPDATLVTLDRCELRG